MGRYYAEQLKAGRLTWRDKMYRFLASPASSMSAQVLTAYSPRVLAGTLESLEVLLPWSMVLLVLLQAAQEVLAPRVLWGGSIVMPAIG